MTQVCDKKTGWAKIFMAIQSRPLGLAYKRETTTYFFFEMFKYVFSKVFVKYETNGTLFQLKYRKA